MYRCHKHHMKPYSNKAKIELTFRGDMVYGLRFLAEKYSEGCVAEFLEEFVLAKINSEFADDLQPEKIREEIARWGK